MAASIIKSGLCTINDEFGLYAIHAACGLRVASFNLKVGSHTDTTKFGVRVFAT